MSFLLANYISSYYTIFNYKFTVDNLRYKGTVTNCMSNENNRIGNWMITYTGLKFYIIDPRPEDIDIRDIAHGLSLICRFNGQCKKFYSVAQHSLYVTDQVPNELKLQALMHDASEAYIADIISPAKKYLTGYAEIENKIMATIGNKFGFNWPMDQKVAEADGRILLNERDWLTNNSEIWNTKYIAYPNLSYVEISSIEAENNFLNKFYSLQSN